MLNNKEKIHRYDYYVYITEELFLAELQDFKDEMTLYSSYKHGELNAYKDVLYNLTGDDKWMRTLDVLQKELL